MANAIKSGAGTGKAGPIREAEIRRGFKVLEVKAVDGTVIPVPSHFAGPNAQIRVDGDGSCVLNLQHNYLVTVLNSKKDPNAEARKTALAMVDELVGNVKDELILAGLKAIRQGKVVQYLTKGLTILGSAHVTIVKALLFDSTSTGSAAEGCIYVKLRNGSVAAIRWIG